jgi:hypothetical protein
LINGFLAKTLMKLEQRLMHKFYKVYIIPKNICITPEHDGFSVKRSLANECAVALKRFLDVELVNVENKKAIEVSVKTGFSTVLASSLIDKEANTEVPSSSFIIVPEITLQDLEGLLEEKKMDELEEDLQELSLLIIENEEKKPPVTRSSWKALENHISKG